MFGCDGRLREKNNAIESLACYRLLCRGSNNRKDAFPCGARQSRYSRWRFPFKSLIIEPSLARNHNIRPLHGRFEIEHLGDEIKTRPDGRTAKAEQAKPKSTRRAGAGRLPKITAQSCITTSANRASASSSKSTLVGVTPF